MNRRRFLKYSAAAAVSPPIIDALAEPSRLDITSNRAALTAAPTTSFSVLQMTDLHLPRFGARQQRVARAANEAKPDLIVITGDSVDAPDKLGVLDEFLSAMDKAIPTVAILGNWEYWSDIGVARIVSMYERHGVEVLVNRSTIMEKNGRSMRLLGLDDFVVGRPDINAALRDSPPADAELILAHCPQQRDGLAGRSSLVLSGHTHGGQINFFGATPYLPQGSGGYERGWYGAPGPDRSGIVRIAGQHRAPSAGAGPGLPSLYVSRGLGTSIVAARFCSIPELARFELLV